MADMKELTAKYSAHIKDPKIYFRPIFLDKKLNNAINSFAPVVRIENVYAYIDGTVFGSGNNGILLTDECIYFKNTFMKADSVQLIYIDKINIKSDSLIINGNEVYSFVSVDKKSQKKFVEYLNAVVQFLKNGKVENEEQKQSSNKKKNSKIYPSNNSNINQTQKDDESSIENLGELIFGKDKSDLPPEDNKETNAKRPNTGFVKKSVSSRKK